MIIQPNELSDNVRAASAPVGLVELPVSGGLYRRRLKRLMDLMAVLCLGILAVPIILVIALILMLDGTSPFYTSARVGRRGQEFGMIKLRTMVADADHRLEGYLARNPDARREWDATQKLKFDPRITLFGRFLRKSSLDELPQLWNVLVGDMSLIGPRPMMPGQRAIYPGLAYYGLRPGMTGLWQISDRNNCTFAERAEIDNKYDRILSFTTDLRILVRTVGAVLRGTGY